MTKPTRIKRAKPITRAGKRQRRHYMVVPYSATHPTWFLIDSHRAKLNPHPDAYLLIGKDSRKLRRSLDGKYVIIKYFGKRPRFLTKWWLFSRWSEWDEKFLRQEIRTARWTEPIDENLV
jgi:hypothetical protein